MSRKLKKLEKQILPKSKTNKKGIIFKIIRIIFLIIFVTATEFFIDNAKSYLEQFAPKSEVLSIAIFAIPAAMFGIYISILVSSANWKKTKFSNTNYETLYKNSNNIFDLTPIFASKIIFDIIFLLIWFLNGEHSKAIAYGIFTTLEFLYLIFFEMWKIHMNVEEYYTNSIINNYLIYCDNYYEKNIRSISQIEKEIKEVKAKIRIKGFLFQNEIQPIMLAILSNNASQTEKLAFVKIIDKMKNQAFTENNILLLSIILECAQDLFEDALLKKDYEYAHLLAEKILTGWINVVNKQIKLYNKTNNKLASIIEYHQKKNSLTKPIKQRLFDLLYTFTLRLSSLKLLIEETDIIAKNLLNKLRVTKELNMLCYGGATISELETLSCDYDESKKRIDNTIRKVTETKNILDAKSSL